MALLWLVLLHLFVDDGIALALPLTSGEDLLRCHLPYWIQQSTLAELIRDAFVDAVLELVDAFDARDLGLVKVV